jgi:hypothetical protein
LRDAANCWHARARHWSAIIIGGNLRTSRGGV